MSEPDDLDERIKKAEAELEWERLRLNVLRDQYHRLLWSLKRPLTRRDVEIFEP